MLTNDITCVLDGIGPYGSIYICSLQTASKETLMKKYKIQAGIFVKDNQRNSSQHLPIEQIMTLEKENISCEKKNTYFDDTYKFIEQNRKKTNILISCCTGNELAPLVAITYLMKKYNYNLDTVTSMVKRRRPTIKIQQHLPILKNYQSVLGLKTPQTKLKNKILETYQSTTLQSLKSQSKKLSLNLSNINNGEESPQKPKQYQSFLQNITKRRKDLTMSPEMKKYNENGNMDMPKLRARSSILKKNGSVTQRKPRQKSVRFFQYQ